MFSDTLLALLLVAVGLALHLRWHPLRREFSDAWDFLRLRQPLILLVAVGFFFSGGVGQGSFSWVQLQDWMELWRPLLQRGFTQVALLPHVLLPPWPAALVLPFLLIVLAIRVWRWPYRYGERMPVPEQKLILVALAAGSVFWLLLEALGWLNPSLPEWLQSLILMGRSVCTALMAAMTQVWLARLVIAWEKPPDTEPERDAVAAMEAVFARWQGVVGLGGFNLMWMTWQSWTAGDSAGSEWSRWLLPEMLLICAALPLAVAVSSGGCPFWQMGALALRILLRSAVPLLLLGCTAVVAVVLVSYAADLGLAAFEMNEYGLREAIWGLRALVLAMLHGWLCLAALIAMLRHGFAPPSIAESPPAPPAS